jgi:hypothetical protein
MKDEKEQASSQGNGCPTRAYQLKVRCWYNPAFTGNRNHG